ncbi:hypothetical protein ACJX0J_037711, partial [Zea mays]
MGIHPFLHEQFWSSRVQAYDGFHRQFTSYRAMLKGKGLPNWFEGEFGIGRNWHDLVIYLGDTFYWAQVGIRDWLNWGLLGVSLITQSIEGVEFKLQIDLQLKILCSENSRKLGYLVNTRPDIAFSVGYVSSKTHFEVHATTIKQSSKQSVDERASVFHLIRVYDNMKKIEVKLLCLVCMHGVVFCLLLLLHHMCMLWVRLKIMFFRPSTIYTYKPLIMPNCDIERDLSSIFGDVGLCTTFVVAHGFSVGLEHNVHGSIRQQLGRDRLSSFIMDENQCYVLDLHIMQSAILNRWSPSARENLVGPLVGEEDINPNGILDIIANPKRKLSIHQHEHNYERLTMQKVYV